MTIEEYKNLKIGDLVLFDIDTEFEKVIEDSCAPLLDDNPHKIVRTGMEGGYFRIGFDEVTHSTVYSIGWSYRNCIKYMTKVNPLTICDIDYIPLDIQKEIDIVIPMGDI